MKSRYTELEVYYKGRNISQYINTDLTAFSFTDSQNVADDINIELQDKERKWLKEWAPRTGDTIKAQIKAFNWNKENETLIHNCGTFTIDEPEYTISPKKLNLKAISIPACSSFKDTPKTKIWKKATISKIGQTIADNSGLILVYDSSYNPIITDKEQTETSDFQFIQQLTQEYGLILKVYNNKIVIFSEEEYEKKPIKLTITEDMLIAGTLKTTLSDSGYDGAVLKHKKGSGELIHAEYYPKGKIKKDLKILSLNDSADNYAEALRIAKAKLREKNREQYTMSFSIPGISGLYMGDCYNFENAGDFTGKYIITNIQGSISPFVMNIDAHKVLQGY